MKRVSGRVTLPASSATTTIFESRGFSLLHKCVLEILPLNLEQFLTASTTKPDNIDADGRTSLIWAATRGDEKNLDLLLKNGADPSICDNLRKIPLQHARSAACTRLLLSVRNNLGQWDAYGRTALHAACRRQGGRQGDQARALELLQAGAEVNVDIADVDGHTPVLTAAEANSHQILAVLPRPC